MPDVRPALAAPAEVRAALAAAHRDEWGQVFGALVRFTGDWTLAEDCTQDAFERALTAWTADGIPRVPGAWLTVTARRRALDLIKRSGLESEKLRLLIAGDDGPGPAADAALEIDDWQDDVLRLLFTCCHPALAMPARVALTLRTVGGLTTREIARAFLVSEATISQRILRAKQKIAHAGIPYRVPPPQLIDERTAGVLAVIYLIFTEGYAATDGRVTRDDLAAEAIRLGRLLVALAPRDAEARGLLALMLLQNARRSARIDAGGEIVTLEHQDRRLWDPHGDRRGSRAGRRAGGRSGCWVLRPSGRGCRPSCPRDDSRGHRLGRDRRRLRPAGRAASVSDHRVQSGDRARIMGITEGDWPVVNATYSNASSKQFIVKLKNDLSDFVYSTVFGSGNSANPNISPVAFLVDRCENVYVSGWGGSPFLRDVFWPGWCAGYAD